MTESEAILTVLASFIPMCLFGIFSIAFVFLIIYLVYKQGTTGNKLHQYKETAVNFADKYELKTKGSILNLFKTLTWNRILVERFSLQTFVLYGAHFEGNEKKTALLSFAGYVKAFGPFYSHFRVKTADKFVDLILDDDNINILLDGKVIATSVRQHLFQVYSKDDPSFSIKMTKTGENLVFPNPVNLVYKYRPYANEQSFERFYFMKNDKVILNCSGVNAVVSYDSNDLGKMINTENENLIFDNVDEHLTETEYYAMLVTFFYHISTAEVGQNVVRASSIHH